MCAIEQYLQSLRNQGSPPTPAKGIQPYTSTSNMCPRMLLKYSGLRNFIISTAGSPERNRKRLEGDVERVRNRFALFVRIVACASPHPTQSIDSRARSRSPFGRKCLPQPPLGPEMLGMLLSASCYPGQMSDAGLERHLKMSFPSLGPFEDEVAKGRQGRRFSQTPVFSTPIKPLPLSKKEMRI